jgi:hypothetical protein
VGIGEYESIATALPRCAAESVKLSRDLIGHRNTARRATGLRSAELAQHIVLADPDPAGSSKTVHPEVEAWRGRKKAASDQCL